MKPAQIIIVASHIPVFAAGVWAGVLYSRLSRPLRAFSWFVFLSAAIQLVSLVLWWAKENNMPLLHLYVAAGLPCLLWFYQTLLGNHIHRRITWSISICFLLFTLANSIWVQPLSRFNSNALVAESVVIIIMALFTYIFLLSNTVKEAGMQDSKSIAWINTGLFIYYLSCLLIFYFGDAITFRLPSSLGRLTWVFHSFFSMVMYVCFLTGLWKRSRAHCS